MWTGGLPTKAGSPTRGPPPPCKQARKWWIIFASDTQLNKKSIAVSELPNTYLASSWHCAKRHIFASEFAQIRIGTRGVYDNILRYSSTHDATYTYNILLRIRTVFPNSNRIPSNTMKHSKRHTPDSFSKKIDIDQLRTMMIICHRNILVWPQIFESACDANTTVTNGLTDANTPEY